MMMLFLCCSSLCIAAVAASGTDQWEGAREGRCDRSDYMNIGWNGMSEGACRERAFQVQRDGGNCIYVSYSSSPGPTSSGNFCQCHAGCEALANSTGESWESFVVVVVADHGSGGNRDKITVVLIAVVGLLLLCTSGVLCLCRWRHKQASANIKAASNTPEGNDVPVAVAVRVVDTTSHAPEDNHANNV